MQDARNQEPALPLTGRLESVNIGTPRTVLYRGKPVQTSIWKFPVEGAVEVRGVHVGSDVQSDPRVHGGPDKAVYAYASEDYEWWSSQLEEQLGPATFGENLTISGVRVSHAIVGERWQIGGCLLEVSEPRLPCFKLGLKMGDPRFLKRFAKAQRFGAYLRILEAGQVRAGDAVGVVHRPAHNVSVQLMGRSRLEDPSLAVQVLAAPDIPERWRERLEDEMVAQA